MSMYDYGVIQMATLVYDNGHNHISVLARPSLKQALKEGAHVTVHGQLHGDHIDIDTLS